MAIQVGPVPFLFWPKRKAFTTTSGPVITSITPNADKAAGGATVTITGIRFAATPTVLFGSTPSTGVTFIDETQITATVPAHAVGVVDVTVTNPDGLLDVFPFSFTYYSLVVTDIKPNNGPTTGGTGVVITGANFETGATITFNGVAGTGITFIDAQHYAVTTPANVAGPAVVAVNGVEASVLFFYSNVDPVVAIRRNPSVVVTLASNVPASCTYTLDGKSVPPKTQSEISITDQDGNLVFAGVVQRVRQTFEEQTRNLVWSVTAQDYTAWLNRRHPAGSYTNRSATDIVLDLVARYAPWVDTSFVQTNLATLDLVLEGTSSFSETLTEIARQIGRGHWRLDGKVLHFFRSPSTVPTASRPVQPIAVGPGTAPVASQSTATRTDFNYAPGYYGFRTAFIFSNGAESVPGPMSNLVPLDGIHLPQLDNIAIGSGAGAFTVTGRRIYYTFFGLMNAVDLGFFDDITDNTTTTLTSAGFEQSGVRGVPRLPLVAPPANSGSTPGFSESGNSAQSVMGALIPSVLGLVSYTYQKGTYAIVTTNVYADGTESQASLPSAAKTLDGSHAITVQTALGVSINGVPVVFRKVYASRAAKAGDVPDFSLGSTAFWGIIPNNTQLEFTLAPGLKQLGSQAPPAAVEAGPDPNHEDGPNLEEADSPAVITEASSLERSPALESTEDTTQIRNRVIVVGRGLETAPPIVLPIEPPLGASSTDVPVDQMIDPYANAVSSFSDGTMPADYINAHPQLTAWQGGYPMNARWAQIQREQAALSTQTVTLPAPAAVNPQATVLRYAVPGRATVALDPALGVPVRQPFVPSTPIGAPPAITQTVNDGIDHFREYLNNSGITPDYLLAHPYTALMDLAEDTYEAGGSAGATHFNNTPTLTTEALTEGAGVPVTPIVVRPRYQVDDLDSQRYFGQIEVDDLGRPTDGIHENVVDGSRYSSAEACIAAANAELDQFAWPIVTASYAVRGPGANKHRPGRRVTFDMANPPLKGTFAIQDVRIEQILDEFSGSISPRYNVTASSVKFDLNDLLSLIGQPVPLAPIAIGPNPQTIIKATEQTRNETKNAIAVAKTEIADAFTIAPYTFRFASAAAVNAVGTGANAVLIVPGTAGFLMVPIALTSRVKTGATPFGIAGASFQLAWQNTTINQYTGVSLFANAANTIYRSLNQSNTGFANTNQGVVGAGLVLQNSGSATTGGSFDPTDPDWALELTVYAAKIPFK